MSGVYTKREPMIDFDERRLGPPSFTDQTIDQLLAELRGIICDKGEPRKTGFGLKTGRSVKARQDTAESGEWKQTDAQAQLAFGDFAAIEAGPVGTREPKAAAILPGAGGSTREHKRPNPPAFFIGGDFAAIEAGLLGAPQVQSTATVSETGTSKAFPSVHAGPKGGLDRENRPAPRRDRRAERQMRSWRSLPLLAAIAFAGMAGTAAIFGLASSPSEPGSDSIRAENGTIERQREAASGSVISAQDAPILGRLSEPSPRVLVNGHEQTFGAPQSEETTPAADSQVQPDNGAAPAPAPLSKAAPVESNTVNADLVPSVLPSGASPQANLNEALPAPQPAQTAEPVANPQKHVAGKHRSHRGELRQIAIKSKPTQTSPLPAGPVPSAGPEAQSPAVQPSPATDGVFGFLQRSVKAFTTATAKLFEGTN